MRVGASPIDIDATNESILPLCPAIPPRVAANLAVEIAQAIDCELEQASDQMFADIQALGKYRLRCAEPSARTPGSD